MSRSNERHVWLANFLVHGLMVVITPAVATFVEVQVSRYPVNTGALLFTNFVSIFMGLAAGFSIRLLRKATVTKFVGIWVFATVLIALLAAYTMNWIGTYFGVEASSVPLILGGVLGSSLGNDIIVTAGTKNIEVNAENPESAPAKTP